MHWRMILFLIAIVVVIGCLSEPVVELQPDAVHTEVLPEMEKMTVEVSPAIWKDFLRFKVDAASGDSDVLGEGAAKYTINVESHPKVSLFDVEGMTIVWGMLVVCGGIVAVVFVYGKTWAGRAKTANVLRDVAYDAIEFVRGGKTVKKMHAKMLESKGNHLKEESDKILRRKGFLGRSKEKGDGKKD